MTNMHVQCQQSNFLIFRGALKFHISAYKLAVRDLTEAIAIDCTCLLAYFNRAVCYHAMKHYQKVYIILKCHSPQL